MGAMKVKTHVMVLLIHCFVLICGGFGIVWYEVYEKMSRLDVFLKQTEVNNGLVYISPKDSLLAVVTSFGLIVILCSGVLFYRIYITIIKATKDGFVILEFPKG